MNSPTNTAIEVPQRPKRADALRNYERLLEAARTTFAEAGAAASLEEIARRAEVGIGTLYRHFPTRPALLEAVYLEEVQTMCDYAQELTELAPWEALATWLHEFVSFAAKKRALAEELVAYMDSDAQMFLQCSSALNATGGELLRRAQEAGVARPDAEFTDVGRMVAGIAVIRNAEPEQIERIFTMALDGLRYRPS